MTLRFPLYAKILLWFFLNLALLGIGFYGFVKMQFKLELDSLLSGKAGDHFQKVSEVITEELREVPPLQWDSVLKRFSSGYHVQFLLFRGDGAQAAGENTELPPPVMARITERRGGGYRQGRGPPLGRMPPLGRGPLPELDPPFETEPLPRFVVQTAGPTRYWVGVNLPGIQSHPGRPWRMTLLAVSDSIRGGGLFLDLTPWVAVGFAAVLFSVLFWIPLVIGITRSISQMTRATEQIAEGKFETRVPTRRRDELGRLGQAINRMASRLAGFVAGQKRFLGDTAHELCSPLARVQVALGILEQQADARYQSYVDDVREEVQHMSSLVNELLSFSRAALRKQDVPLRPVQLAELVQQVVSRETSEQNQMQVNVPDSLRVLAEPELLARALANLIRNALRYAAETGPLQISAAAQGSAVILTVADCGPGIAESALEQIFDPFYRVESSRSRETGGIGLGLAIVKTCVEACQGTVSARNRQPSGLQVELVLKAVNPE